MKLQIYESEWTPGVGDGQGGLACCDSWGCKESDMTERLNWMELMEHFSFSLIYICSLLIYAHIFFAHAVCRVDLTSTTRGWNCAPCIGSTGPNHWTAREFHMLFSYLLLFLYKLPEMEAYIFFFNFILFLNLHNCIRFAKYQNESATGIHVYFCSQSSLRLVSNPLSWAQAIYFPFPSFFFFNFLAVLNDVVNIVNDRLQIVWMVL